MSLNNFIQKLMALALIGIPLNSFGGSVRNVVVDASKMFPIALRMGRSTVLTFKEKPKRVVIGNQNYYNLEFVEGTNHITLQPQSPIATNLFVYGENKVYGFILSAKSAGHYDDLVKISWKKDKRTLKVKGKFFKISPYHETSVDRSASFSDIKFVVNRLIKKGGNNYILDAVVISKKSGKVDLRGLEIALMRGRKKLKGVKTFFEKKYVSNDAPTKVRLFVTLKSKRSFRLKLSFRDKSKKVVISKKMLK